MVQTGGEWDYKRKHNINAYTITFVKLIITKMKNMAFQNRIIKLLLIFQLVVVPKLFAQNIAINTTGNVPDASAMLDITSSTQGLLTPRMTTAQMNAIALPATGLLIYNTSLSVFEVNIGTSSSPNWVPIETMQSGTNTLSSSANTITSTVNGVAATAPAVNTVSNTVSNNTVLTTVNGIAGTAVTVPNIYTSDGTLAANRTVTMGTNTLTFQNGTSTAALSQTSANSSLTFNAPIRSYIQEISGSGASSSVFSMFQDASSAGQLTIGGASTELDLGSASGSTAPLNLMANGTRALTVINGGNVGIGTTSPAAQLHTTGTVRFAGLGSSTGNTNLLTTDASGNVTTTAASSILSAGTSVSNTAGTNTISTTVNGVTGTAVTVPNLYTANGTLTGARTVTGGTNALAFTTGIINGFSVAGSTLSVDGANNRIGVGTTLPNSTLQVTGSVAGSVAEVSASTTLDATYHFVDVNSASGTTITLPAVSGITGREYIVRNVNSGTVTISVSGGGNLRVGSTTTTSVTLTSAGQSYTIVAGSTNWEVITPAASALPTMILAATNNQTLTAPGAGGAVNVGFSSPSVNTITGSSFNTGTSQITLPAGIYMVTWSYNGTVTMSSTGMVNCFWDVPGAGNRAEYSVYASSTSHSGGTPVFYPVLTSATSFNFSIGTGLGTSATTYLITSTSRLYIVKIG